MAVESNGLILLAREHREIERLHDTCVQSPMDASERYRRAHALGCRLAAHSVLEMQLLFPLLREAGIDPDYLGEAVIEQVLLEDLVSAIVLGGPDDPALGMHLRKLGQLARDHVRVQERELFAFARITGVDTESLGQQLDQMQGQARVHVQRHVASLRARHELAARSRPGDAASRTERSPPCA